MIGRLKALVRGGGPRSLGILKKLSPALHGRIESRAWTRAARAERARDSEGVPDFDCGTGRAIELGVRWLCLAQDRSATRDGGVARHFSLVTGWGPSYPETTGYIIPTLLAYAECRRDGAVRDRVKRMLDWLVSIQFPNGGFQGGAIGSTPCVPVTFNTGQILLGLTSGVRHFGKIYHEAMARAARWLVQTQDPDGCWRRFPTPFAAPGEKTYETHVAWGLFEAANVEKKPAWREAALANVRWSLRWQLENGWFQKCCLVNPAQPLTHTIGYALRGILEGYRFTKDPTWLEACTRTADGLLKAMTGEGFLPGRLDATWRGTVPWACLTGTAQIAHCWLLLYQETRDPQYKEAALAANRFVRRTIRVSGPPEIRGAIKGSFPVDGEYGRYQYPNWAVKFVIDSNMLEMAVGKE